MKPNLVKELKHTCHALGCQVSVPPEMLMCRRHWFMVPKAIRDRVWSSYRRGQCDDKSPSREWLKAAKEAIRYVAIKERRLFLIPRTRARTDTRLVGAEPQGPGVRGTS